MKNPRVWAIAGIVVLALIFYKLTCSGRRQPDGYVLDKNHHVTGEDLKLYFRSIDLASPDAGRYFSGSIANPQTIRFFKTLQRKYSQMSLEDHLKAVKDYLFSIMSPQKAEEAFSLYSKFTSYETSLLQDSKRWKKPRNPEDALEYLHRIQEYRREYFGRDTADQLFGTEVKLQEYHIRKGSIAGDKNLYGAEKEKKVAQLQSDMWGDEGGSVEGLVKPYNQYTEKLQMYQRDLNETDDSGRREKIEEFRKEIFPPDVVRRFEKIDEEIAADTRKESSYRKAETTIRNDPNLSAEEKQKRIESLQNDVFGDQADAFRRRDNIARESENKH